MQRCPLTLRERNLSKERENSRRPRLKAGFILGDCFPPHPRPLLIHRKGWKLVFDVLYNMLHSWVFQTLLGAIKMSENYVYVIRILSRLQQETASGWPCCSFLPGTTMLACLYIVGFLMSLLGRPQHFSWPVLLLKPMDTLIRVASSCCTKHFEISSQTKTQEIENWLSPL